MRSLLLWAGLLLAAPAAAGGLEACLVQEGEIDLARRVPLADCPPAARLLERLGERLDPHPGAEPSVAQLLDLAQLAATLDQPPAAPRLDRAALEPLLEAASQAEELSWWQRTKRWLRERLRRAQEEDGWLAEWLRRLDFNLSDEAADTTVELLTLLLIALAAGVLLNELRLVRWRRAAAGREVRGRPGGAPAAAADPLPEWEALAALPPREQAVALWRHALALLAARRLLTPHRARTLREYRRTLRSRPEAEWSAPAETLAQGAEQALYGPRELPVALSSLRGAAERLRALLAGGAP